MPIQPLGQERSLEKEAATHSSILAWEISWTEESGGLESMGHNVSLASAQSYCLSCSLSVHNSACTEFNIYLLHE